MEIKLSTQITLSHKGNSMTKTVVLTTQHENWDDDGGDHDCFAITVEDADFIKLKKLSEDVCDEGDFADIIIRAIPKTPEDYPLLIDGIFTIWYRY